MDEDERRTWAAEYGIKDSVRLSLTDLCYKTLDVITFLTANEKEAHAWTIRRGASAVEAASRVHTDIARGFIRAETTAFADLRDCGSFKDTRAQGKTRLEGKDYLVQDGDILQFRFGH